MVTADRAAIVMVRLAACERRTGPGPVQLTSAKEAPRWVLSGGVGFAPRKRHVWSGA